MVDGTKGEVGVGAASVFSSHHLQHWAPRRKQAFLPWRGTCFPGGAGTPTAREVLRDTATSLPSCCSQCCNDALRQ